MATCESRCSVDYHCNPTLYRRKVSDFMCQQSEARPANCNLQFYTLCNRQGL